MSFKTSVALLIFCLDDLFLDVSEVLKSPTIIVFLSISPFMSVSICFVVEELWMDGLAPGEGLAFAVGFLEVFHLRPARSVLV